jgi:hypothetical protein
VSAPPLAELQVWLQWIVTDPRGAETLVLDHAEECRRRLGGRAWQDWVAPVADGRPERRLDVYAEGFVARLADALAESYEAVHWLLGAERFRALTRRYLAAHPPHHYDLAQAGAALPEHLANDPLTVELPFLPDLARLERAVMRAFHAELAPALTAADLAGFDAERLAGARLVLQEYVAGLRSAWPIRSLRELRGVPLDEISLRVLDDPQEAIVHRAGLGVVVRDPEPGELACLDALRAGATLEEALGAAAAAGADARVLDALFARWAASGVVVDVVEDPCR